MFIGNIMAMAKNSEQDPQVQVKVVEESGV